MSTSSQRLARLVLLVAVAAIVCTPGGPAQAQTPTPRALFFPARGGEVALNVEVADTPEKQEIGLMNRTSMPEDSGMLFIFPETVLIGFWMKDTLIPLSVAFIAS